MFKTAPRTVPSGFWSRLARVPVVSDGVELSERTRTLERWRRSLAIVGLAALVGLAILGTIGGSSVWAGIAFLGFACATVLTWLEIRALCRTNAGSTRSSGLADLAPRLRSRPSLGQRLAPFVAALIAFGAVQSWFKPGTAIAGGDIAPPNGTAWLGQIFSPWLWSGSDLGRPATLETQLPWGVVIWLVHSTGGGSAALAQQVWYSALFAGAALGAYALLRLLGLGALGALGGSLVYIFNPYVLSTAGTNPVFLATLVLLPVEAGIVLAVASGRWRIRTGVLCLLGTVPLLGYAYENPPLIISVGFSILIAALLGGSMYGPMGRRRVALTLALGIPLVALGSLYWVVPSLEQLHVLAVHQLSTIASWSWTEGRSTLANAFWLNTSWGWRYTEYFPYARVYSSFPLDLLKYGIPVVGFGALALPYRQRDGGAITRVIVVAVVSTVALLFILLSTGTNFPGSLLFDPLYRLPYGWLLQEPGRFLMLSALGYTVLAAMSIEAAISALAARRLYRSGYAPWPVVRLASVSAIVALVVVAPGYPLAFGAVVSGPRAGHMPSSHVAVPAYWTAMASYLNRGSTPAGSLLVFPPDDFYQMPYTWYYGNDGFITTMVSRGVLDPSAQGYGPAPGELETAVNEAASSLLAGRTREANLLLEALGTPDVLVRGDVIANFPGRHIDSPEALARALANDPAMRLVHRVGPLQLFRLRHAGNALDGVRARVQFATVNTASPDLAALTLFGHPRVLLSYRPIRGAPAVYELGPLRSWRQIGSRLYERVALTPGYSYSIAMPGNIASRHGGIPGTRIGTGRRPSSLGSFRARIVGSPLERVAVIDMPLSAQLLHDGSFRNGSWGKVGDCNDVLGAAARAYLHAQVEPGEGPDGPPALMLSASEDAACVSEKLNWHGGPVLLTLSGRQLTGSAPSICVWESGPNICAPLPALSASPRWTPYRAVINPALGATALSLFLYARPPSQGIKTVDEYANVSARSVPESTAPVVVGTPSARENRGMPVLTVQDASYSSIWKAAPAARHVLVDGIMNGWLAPPALRVVPRDSLNPVLRTSLLLSSVAGAVGVILLGSLAVSVTLERRRGRISPGAFKGYGPT